MTSPVKPSRSSVPLSVYRELIKELQISQAHLQEIQTQNQALIQENQELRQALAKIDLEKPPTLISVDPSLPLVEKTLKYPRSGFFLGVVVFLVVITCGLGAFWAVRSFVKR